MSDIGPATFGRGTPRQSFLIAAALLELLAIDVISLFGFAALARNISNRRPSERRPPPRIVDDVVSAVKVACVLYLKQAQCLQRSAVVTRLLRRYGVNARLLIGCQTAPFRSHAWVEVDQRIVSDGRSDIAFYQVIDRW